MCNLISKLLNRKLYLNKEYKAEIISIKSHYEFNILIKKMCFFNEYECKLNQYCINDDDNTLLTKFNTSINQNNRIIIIKIIAIDDNNLMVDLRYNQY